MASRRGTVHGCGAAALAAGIAVCLAHTAWAASTDVFGTLLGQEQSGINYTLPFAQLQLCPSGAQDCVSATTDSTGTFQFQSLAPGAYTIKVPLKDGSMSSDQIVVPDTGSQWLNIITK